MSRRSDQPSVRSRIVLSLGVAGIAVVALAARQPATTAKPPAAAPPAAAPAADSQKAKTDSAAPAAATTDSAKMAAMPGMAGMDMPGVNHMAMKPAAPAAKPGQYPVDPATGRTLINGVPVVGRVFVQQHTDGTVKIPSVAAALAVEPPAALAPIVKKSYTPAKSLQTRRMRGAMIQATLWDMDHKRSAALNRNYGPQR